jgi:hypothetical protein
VKFLQKSCENLEVSGGSPLSAPEGGPILDENRVETHFRIQKVRDGECSFISSGLNIYMRVVTTWKSKGKSDIVVRCSKRW